MDVFFFPSYSGFSQGGFFLLLSSSFFSSVRPSFIPLCIVCTKEKKEGKKIYLFESHHFFFRCI
jgi:hypothetical protein